MIHYAPSWVCAAAPFAPFRLNFAFVLRASAKFGRSARRSCFGQKTPNSVSAPLKKFDNRFISNPSLSGSTRKRGASHEFPLRGESHRASLKKLFCGLFAAIAVTAATKDVGGFRSAFAIRATVIVIFPRDAVATRMGALLWIFHGDGGALYAPFAFRPFPG